ncbi:hypothetical protein [Cochleicola gelatinilyticus]|uniref:Uncharacterized protein n=1 Tax=Cochleicola gelatinilyticus TaxID=1763537 RepID=A0A167HMP6_9FLAO|nr:hypothetical protein [Cochleicola gelatinilyticus]OAB78777.1 hypothetical protein ULVI_09350 [Cochleicola gelatinilyticus]
MTISEILQLPNKQLKKHIDTLVIDYKNKTGYNVCKSCASDVQNMLSALKNIYKMTQFQLKKPQVIYKLEKGSSITISNSKMSDELAIAFLKINPNRLELFSKYPENVKELIGAEETGDNTENEEVKTDKKPCSDCKKKSKLLNTNMNDLRAKYPEIMATSKKDFVDQILTLKNEDI